MVIMLTVEYSKTQFAIYSNTRAEPMSILIDKKSIPFLTLILSNLICFSYFLEYSTRNFDLPNTLLSLTISFPIFPYMLSIIEIELLFSFFIVYFENLFSCFKLYLAFNINTNTVTKKNIIHI